jgi:hypothetical protein
MDWIKRNLYFVVWGAVSIVLLGLAGWFLFANMGESSNVDASLTQIIDERKTLWESNPHPVGEGDVSNFAEAKKDQGRLQKFLTEIKAVIPPMPPRVRVDEPTFRNILDQTIFSMQTAAALGKVSIPEKYGFTFGPIRGKFNFNTNSLEPLLLQLGDIRVLVQALISARVNGIESLRRPAIAEEDSAGGADYLGATPTTNQFTVIMPYEISFRAFSSELESVINGIMNATNCIVVKSVTVVPSQVSLLAEGEAAPPSVFPGVRSGPQGPQGMDRYRPSGRPQPAETAAPTPGANPSQPTTVLNERPLHVTMLVDIVRLAETNPR